jgi:hypothetical protein
MSVYFCVDVLALQRDDLLSKESYRPYITNSMALSTTREATNCVVAQ